MLAISALATFLKQWTRKTPTCHYLTHCPSQVERICPKHLLLHVGLGLDLGITNPLWSLVAHATSHSMNTTRKLASSGMASVRNTNFGWNFGTFSRALLFGSFGLKGMTKYWTMNNGMTTRWNLSYGTNALSMGKWHGKRPSNDSKIAL